MTNIAALALASADAAFMARPPRAPHGPRRATRLRRPDATGIARRLIRAALREIADATTATPANAAPRLRNYPY